MMTPKLLTNAQQAAVYYEADDYYVDGEQLSPSSWWGEGASRLGLRGAVDRDAFHELLHGRLPNGVDISRGGGTSHRPGLDLTFSAPKSVSLVALVGADDRVLKAHEHAVTVALRQLEKNAVRARAMREGVTRIEATDNLVVARFNHDSSRARDPQLHSHAVVLNVTQRGDEEWRAISNEEIFRSVKTASVIYRAELAAQLEELGYRVERTHADGRFEIAGVSKDVLTTFSQRRAQIEKHLEEHGFEGAKAAAVAARATREKKVDVDRTVLRTEWSNRARELGLDFSSLRSRSRQRDLGELRAEADRALDLAVAHLVERNVIASERRLLQVGLAFGLGVVRLDDLQRGLDRKVKRGELVAAASSKEKDPFARHFTTDRALAVERAIIDVVEHGRGRVEPILSTDQIESALHDIDRQAPHRLTRGQAEAIRLVLSSSDRVVGIQGYAGTGKTTGALLHICRMAEMRGIEVRGFAPSAAAAEILQHDAGIESMTLARFLRSRSKELRSRTPQLWILDECSMMGNEAAHALLRQAERARARVVLVGDRDQLPAIEAGRAFGLLMDHGLEVAAIETIVRQKDQVLRQAVIDTIAREHDKAVERLHPQISAIEDRAERLRVVADAYAALPEEERRCALVLTLSNRDRRALNELIRGRLQEQRAIGADRLRASILVAKDLTRAEIQDLASYQVGDVVRFGRSYKRLRVEKDSYWTVASIGPDRGVITLSHAEARKVRWKPSAARRVEVYEIESRPLAAGDIVRWTRNDAESRRVNGEVGRVVAIDHDARTAQVLASGKIQAVPLDRELHWEHAYASTVHAAQGRTADRVFLHIDSREPHLIGHESWYVGISRARAELRIFTDQEEKLPLALKRPLQQPSAHEVAQDQERRTERKPDRRTERDEDRASERDRSRRAERRRPGMSFGR